MRTTFLFAALMTLSSCTLFGEIKNGYETQFQFAVTALQKLNARLSTDKDLALLEKQYIRAELKKLTEIISRYELTQQLINQLRTIAPAMYNEIDSIKDKKRRPTDIFIKLIPPEESRVQLRAATFFRQARADEDASYSEYGIHSVSVNVCIGHDALVLLSHELGHISYVVPNLAPYVSFYNKYYKKELFDFSYVGHSHADQSGRMALFFEQRFRADLAYYLITGGMRFESVASLIDRIKRNSRKAEIIQHPEFSFAWAFARR